MIKVKSLAIAALSSAFFIATAHAQGVGQLGAGQVWGNSGTASAPAAPAFLYAPFSATAVFVNSAPYNAKCDGVTDDTAAIQAAINAQPASRGYIGIPPNANCAWSGVLDFKGHNNLTLAGVGSGFGSSGTNSSRLTYTGPNVTRAMDFRDTNSDTIVGLSISNTTAAMTGFLVDAGGTNPGVTLSAGFSVKDSSIFGGTQAGTAAACLNLSESQLATGDHVWFQRCQPAIHGQNIPGQSTAAKISNSTFTTHTGPAIIGCGEAWSLTDDTWEADVNGRANAFANGAVACKSLLFDNPWMGDVSATGGTWISFLGNGLEVRGGRITANTPTSNEAITFFAGSTGIKISGPAVFENFSTAIDFASVSVTGVEVGGGVTFLNVTNKFTNMSGVTGFAFAEGNSPSTSKATAGQLLIGQSAADAAWNAMSGDVTIANTGVTAIGANRVTRAMQAQGAARSVIGVTGNATANVADIQGTANQFLGVNGAGTALAFQALPGPPNYTATTWTPTVTTDGTPGTPAYITQVGSYEQIGRLVTARFNIVLSGWTGSPTGNVVIGGLPVSSNPTTNDLGVCNIGIYTLSTSFASVTAFVPISSTTAPLRATAAGGGNSLAVTAAQAGTTPVLIGSCFYHT